MSQKKIKRAAPIFAMKTRGLESSPREKWMLALGLAVAVCVRLAYYYFSQESPFFEPLVLDPKYYQQWALRILAFGFSGEGVFYGLPLYPAFLALCYKIFGVSIPAVKMVQIALGVGTLFFVYRLGRRIADPVVGLCGVWFGAFYGPAIFHEGIWIPEVLGLLLYTAACDQALTVWERPRAWHGFWLGVLFGLALLTKAGLSVFVFVFIAIAFWKPKTRSAAAACLGAFFLILSPVVAHNFIQGKDTVLLTSHAGFNFYIGNNPKATGVFVDPANVGDNVEGQRQGSYDIAEKEMGRALKPSEVSKFWSDKAWKFIQDNPGRFVQLCLIKAVIFFDGREISDVEDYQFAKNFNPMLRGPWPNFYFLGPWVFVGLWVLLRQKSRAWMLPAFVICYVLGMMLFFVNARYRFPMTGVFLTLGALGLVHAWRNLRKGQWASLFVSAVLLVAGIVVVTMRLAEHEDTDQWLNAGDAMQEKKQYERALEFYASALKADPLSWKAYQAQGVALTKLGRNEEAIDSYLQSIEIHPRDSQAYNNLGLCYDRAGKLEQAERYFLLALERNPDSWQAHNNLGMVYGKQGDYEKAVESFKTSIRLHAQNPRAYTNLGLISHRRGQTEEARDFWRKALSLNPEFEEAKKALSLSLAGAAE